MHGNPGAAAAAPALPADGPVPPAPERPAATLQPGPLDQPAPVAVIEARRAAAIIAATAGHQHGGDYTHRDAGRSPEAFLHEDHLPGAAASAEHDAHAAPGDADGAAPAEAGGEPAALYVCPLHP